ncbi:pyocin knob domain-containing protein, partial [Pseudomonas shirazensis]
MAQQIVSLGTAPNGNDGDDARTAFSKVNDNFTEVYALAGGAQPANAKLTALAGAVWAANQLQYQTGAGTVANTPFTVAARALLDDADSPAMRATLGLGGQILQALQALTMTANGVPYMASASTMAVQPSSAFGRGLLNLAGEAAGRAAFGALGVGDYGIGNALTLAGGTNLNALTTPGVYAFTSGSALVNSPYGAACYVEVFGRAAYPWQIVSPIYGTGDTFWTRSAKVATPTTAAADWGAWLPTKLGNFGIGERQSPDIT